MDIFWILDPDPHNNRCGSATLAQPWRNYNMEWPRGENCIKMGGRRAYIVYITSRRRTVRLGSRQELYERFLIRKLIRYSPPTQPVQKWAPPVLLPPCANYGDRMAKVKRSLLLKARLENYSTKELCPGRFLLTWSMGYRQHCLNFSQKPATVEF